MPIPFYRNRKKRAFRQRDVYLSEQLRLCDLVLEQTKSGTVDIRYHLPQPQSSLQPSFGENARRFCTTVLTAKIVAAKMIAMTIKYWRSIKLP